MRRCVSLANSITTSFVTRWSRAASTLIRRSTRTCDSMLTLKDIEGIDFDASFGSSDPDVTNKRTYSQSTNNDKFERSMKLNREEKGDDLIGCDGGGTDHTLYLDGSAFSDDDMEMVLAADKLKESDAYNAASRDRQSLTQKKPFIPILISSRNHAVPSLTTNLSQPSLQIASQLLKASPAKSMPIVLHRSFIPPRPLECKDLLLSSEETRTVSCLSDDEPKKSHPTLLPFATVRKKVAGLSPPKKPLHDPQKIALPPSSSPQHSKSLPLKPSDTLIRIANLPQLQVKIEPKLESSFLHTDSQSLQTLHKNLIPLLLHNSSSPIQAIKAERDTKHTFIMPSSPTTPHSQSNVNRSSPIKALGTKVVGSGSLKHEPSPEPAVPVFVLSAQVEQKESFMDKQSAIRSFSTLSKAAAAQSKSNPYHTIQLATQRPNAPTSQLSTLKKVKPVILSAEQEYVLRQVLNGVSLFFTGSAGTGKSVLLRQIIKELRRKHSSVAVTASTGLAACNIGGITLHSFAGVGLATENIDILCKKARRNPRAMSRWLTTKVLVIDEISMVDGHLLNKFNELAKKIRKKKEPFGGIQLVMCGDFYQLPPVVKNMAPDGTEYDNPPEAFFAFESEAWSENVNQTIILQEVFRQKGDKVFIDMLNELRNGCVTEETAKNFHALLRPLQCPLGIMPAELFATRNEVDRANNTRLNRINGSARLYSAVDNGSLPPPQLHLVLSNFIAPQQLYLKVGAQVMCLKNYDETLVNGSIGQVIGFTDKDSYMKGLEKDGVSLDDKVCTSDYVFDKSNKNSSKDKKPKKKVVTADDEASKAGQKRKEALGEDIANDSKNKLHPLVKFMQPDGVNCRTILVEPETWSVEDEKQQVLASRMQLPLILAWALSIHKSQGQTLPKVKVDLRKVFETGQSYVALSRAVLRDGLQVLNFQASKVRSHPRVKEFYKTLESATDAMRKPRGQMKVGYGQQWLGF